MVGVALDFRRPPFVAFYEQADGIRAKRHGRGIKLRFAERQPIGLLNVRNDVLFRSTAATGKTSKSQ